MTDSTYSRRWRLTQALLGQNSNSNFLISVYSNGFWPLKKYLLASHFQNFFSWVMITVRKKCVHDFACYQLYNSWKASKSQIDDFKSPLQAVRYFSWGIVIFRFEKLLFENFSARILHVFIVVWSRAINNLVCVNWSEMTRQAKTCDKANIFALVFFKAF